MMFPAMPFTGIPGFYPAMTMPGEAEGKGTGTAMIHAEEVWRFPYLLPEEKKISFNYASDTHHFGGTLYSQGDTETEDEDPSDLNTEKGDNEKNPGQGSAGRQKKRSKTKIGSGMGVKSNSQAALALLATAAGGANPMHTQQPNMFDMWGQLNGAHAAVAAAAAAAALNNPGAAGVAAGTVTGTGARAQSARAGAESGFIDGSGGGGSDFDEAALAGLDEREVKRLRRKQSNRESARRSRLRKQAECEHLLEENKLLQAEIHQLRLEKVELNAQIAVLEAKLSISVSVESKVHLLK